MKEFAATDRQRLSFEIEKETKRERRPEQKSVHDSNTGKSVSLAEALLDETSMNEATKMVMTAYKELKNAEKNARHLVPIPQAGLDAVMQIQKNVVADLAKKKGTYRQRSSSSI